MTPCERTRAALTAYLDGELDPDLGSAVRGHLRGCADCRQVATDEAALRDGLRALPPLDPPASLWEGVQARLAAAEIADAQRPAWRRLLARWLPRAPRYSLAGVAFAAAAGLVVWHHARAHHPVAGAPPALATAAPDVHPPAPPAPPATAPAPLATGLDVTADLAAAPARETKAYADAAADLLELAQEERAQWSDAQREQFDTRVAALRKTIAAADEGPPRQRAYRTLIRYLQGAAIRDAVGADDQMLAGSRGTP